MKKILIIDDELSKIDESKNFVDKYGLKEYEYLFAMHKGEALKILESNKNISLIILDIVFNNMNDPVGLEEIKAISKEIWPSGQDTLSGNEYGLPMLNELRARYPQIPVVILSSKTVSNVLLWCWRNGACYYVIKPPEDRKTVKGVLDSFSI